MKIPTIKSICDDVSDSLNLEEIDFQCMLNAYIEFICNLFSSKEFADAAGKEGVNIFYANIHVLKCNALNNIDRHSLNEKRLAILKLNNQVVGDLKKITKIISTGLTDKDTMLEYSHYPEYLTEDMLGIAVIVLYDLHWKYAVDFTEFLKENCRKF